MNINFEIIPHGSSEWVKAVNLREEILRKPLGSVFSEEELAAEKDHIQVVGFRDRDIIATAVLVPEGKQMKMQRVVVSEALRNQQIGAKMMKYCESYCRHEGYTEVYCHARDSAVKFYRDNHYLAVGDYFDEDGIPHIKMKKPID